MKKIIVLLMLLSLQSLIVAEYCSAQKMLRGALILPDESPLGSARMYIDGFESQATTTATDGYFKLPLPEVLNQQSVIRCYVIPEKSKLRYSVSFANDSTKFISITIAPINEDEIVIKKNVKDNKITNNTENTKIEVIEDNKKVKKDIAEEGMVGEGENTNVDNNNNNTVNEVIDNTPKTLEEEIKAITDELKDEQEIILRRNEKIKNQIERITDRLKNETNISPEERERLLKLIEGLEDQLDLNMEQFAQLQEELKRMKGELTETTEVLELGQQAIYTLTGIVLFLAVMAYLLFILSKRRKKEADLIRSQKSILEKQKTLLDERVDEISSQKEQLESQQEVITVQKEILENTNQKLERTNKEIELQNKKTQDSIKAALTIQNSILPDENFIKKRFTDHFIIFEPKDIVSGDFYWLHSFKKQLTILGVIDCTGHGVPGAFMSMIGHSILTELVKARQHEFTPAELLNGLNMGVGSRLKQLEQEENDDGMDASICMIETIADQPNKRKITFAGAKQEMVYIHKNKLEVIKGTRRGIAGPYLDSEKEFITTEVVLDVGDALYMYSDGVVDTPNPERKRFGSKNLWDLLEQNHHLTMKEQHDILINTLRDYKQDTEQRDDVTLIGVRL